MADRLLAFLAALCLWLVCAAPASAHEVRPAYLEITRPAPGHFHILWKQPTAGEMAVKLTPRLSNGWLDRRPTDQWLAPGYALTSWDIAAPASASLQGVEVEVDGLQRTITDVLVRADSGVGAKVETVLRPSQPSLVLDFGKRDGLRPLAYLRMGIEHILTGLDHLSFVLGLLLLVGPRWRLLKAITAFTVAHSITLACAALGLVNFPSALIEAMVAMSILFLASELVRQHRGETGLTMSHPWLIAFCFGLLHGLAFAGALADVGLPRDAIPQSLFLFNVGVEIGQLAFVGAVLLLVAIFRRLAGRLPARALDLALSAPRYAIGTFAAFWLIQRLGPLFT